MKAKARAKEAKSYIKTIREYSKLLAENGKNWYVWWIIIWLQQQANVDFQQHRPTRRRLDSASVVHVERKERKGKKAAENGSRGKCEAQQQHSNWMWGEIETRLVCSAADWGWQCSSLTSMLCCVDSTALANCISNNMLLSIWNINTTHVRMPEVGAFLVFASSFLPFHNPKSALCNYERTRRGWRERETPLSCTRLNGVKRCAMQCERSWLRGAFGGAGWKMCLFLVLSRNVKIERCSSCAVAMLLRGVRPHQSTRKECAS